MKQADSLLLNALKVAIHNEKAALGVLPQETQTELLRQAVRHGVLPLVLDACGKALKAARQMAFCQTAEQILKARCALRCTRSRSCGCFRMSIYWRFRVNLTAHAMLYCGSAAAHQGRVSIRLNRYFTCPAVRSF